MLKWVAEVSRKYQISNLKWKILLVIENETTYKTSKVKDKIKECENSFQIIPSGLTWRQQPLDITINKVLNETK